MNNYHTRLKVYEQALSDYRWARFQRLSKLFGRRSERSTCAGLCLYFHLRDINLYKLPELVEFKPSQDVLDKYGDFWAPRGELTPRIKVLKAAIKLTKQKIKGHAH